MYEYTSFSKADLAMKNTGMPLYHAGDLFRGHSLDMETTDTGDT